MLMVDNMHDAEPLIRLAHAWGINIAFSGYNDMKNGNQGHFVAPEKMAEFRAVCRRIIALKRELGNVMTSDYFFETLPEFYVKRDLPGCQAGKIMVHVSPRGMVQPCAELLRGQPLHGVLVQGLRGPQLRQVLRLLPRRAPGPAHAPPRRGALGRWHRARRARAEGGARGW